MNTIKDFQNISADKCSRHKNLLPVCTLLLLAALAPLFLAPVCTFATTGVNAPTVIKLDATQTTFRLPLTVTSERPYAGAEFAWQCTSGLSLQSVSYPAGSSHVGPVLARGLYWFSYFSGANDFGGTTDIVAIFKYTGHENARIYLDHVELMTRTGVAVDGALYASRIAIEVRRAGAVNVPPPLQAPPDAVPAGSRNEGKLPVAGTPQKAPVTATKSMGASGSSASGNNESRLSAAADDSPKTSGTASSSSGSSAAGASASGSGQATGQSRVPTQTAAVTQSQPPQAAGPQSDNPIRAGSSFLPNLLWWLLGAAGGSGLLFAGYTVIKHYGKECARDCAGDQAETVSPN
jgi:hypothetical protein